ATKRKSSFCWCCWRYVWISCSISCCSLMTGTGGSNGGFCAASEITFALLGFHRPLFVEVDEAALPLGILGEQHLSNDLGQRVGGGGQSPRQGIAAEGAKAHPPQLRLLPWMQSHARVVHHDQRAVALHHRPLCRQVQGDDRDLLEIDVQPDVELRPIGQRKRADALPLDQSPVVEIPQLRALVLGVPLPVAITERVDPLFGA